MNSSVADDSTACIERPRLLGRGLDSLYVSYYLDMANSALDFDELTFEKENAAQSRIAKYAGVELGTEKFALRPYGRKPYSFVLANDAFEVRLGEHIRPSCYVQFFSEGLWMLGLDGVIGRIDAWRQSMKLEQIKPEVVGRADWAFDYHLPAIDFTPDHFLTRAAKHGTWREHRRLQSIQLGTGNVVIRVYDKVAEIQQQSGKAWLYEIWGRSGEVCRIEFQVRRDALHPANINSIAELKDFQGDLLRQLVTGHTSLRTPSSDSNRSRWPLHKLWRALKEDIATLPQTGLVQAIDPQASLTWRLAQQTQALYGSLKGIGAVLRLLDRGNEMLRLDEVLAALPDMLEPYHNRLIWQADIRQRLKAYELGQW